VCGVYVCIATLPPYIRLYTSSLSLTLKHKI
jgi:hypothetical protein